MQGTNTNIQNTDTNLLNERIDFIKFDEHEQGALKAAKPVIDGALEDVLQEFYTQVSSYETTRSFFQNQAHMDGAKSAQVSHWNRITNTEFDENYVSAVSKIGLAHARIGLEPRWHIGGYALLTSGLLKAIIEDECKGFFNRKITKTLVRRHMI